MDVRQRLEELRAASVAELRPPLDRFDLEPRRVDHRLGLVRIDGANGIDDRAAGAHPLRGRAQQLQLQLRQRARPPAEIGTRREHAEAGARCVDERPVESRQLGRERTPVRVDDGDVVGPEPAGILLELARPGLVHLDRDDLAGQHRRLAARGGAEVEDALAGLGADAQPGELRAATLRPNLAVFQGFLVDARRPRRRSGCPLRTRPGSVPGHV